MGKVVSNKKTIEIHKNVVRSFEVQIFSKIMGNIFLFPVHKTPKTPDISGVFVFLQKNARILLNAV